VIPNGLDPAPFARPPRGPAGHQVIMVANLRPEKGHDVLIDAAPEVLREFPDARFDVVGGGSERASLVARAGALGVAHAFAFVGHTDDVPARLARSDLFVLPSRSEAFPNALLEAMAAGLPSVACGVGGVLELVEHGRTGLLVPPGNPRELAEALKGLMRDPARAASLGEAARAVVETRYSFDRMVAAFEAMYLERLAARRAARGEDARAALRRSA
jgi:glycosyltransferase involved in cell wall biosynthesis